MKTLTTLLLSLCLLSSSAFADVTLYGLTLGKATIAETQQRYTLIDKRTATGLPNTWNFFSITADQLNTPPLKRLTVYFNEQQVLGEMRLTYPPASQTFNELDVALSNRYIKKPSPAINNPNWTKALAHFEAPNTKIVLEHYQYGTTLTFTDTRYKQAADKAMAVEAAKAQ